MAGNTMYGKQAAGAPFNVIFESSQSTSHMRVATYAIKPGDTLEREFSLSLFQHGRYTVDVVAPNGFYRSFMGNSQAPQLQVRTVYERNGSSLTGNIEVCFENGSERALKVTLEDNSYRMGAIGRELAAGQNTFIVLDLQRSHNWYDFSVRTVDCETLWRCAGRVETGRSGFSDPLIGKMTDAGS